MIQIVPQAKNNGCLLTYSFDTYPSPLQVSPAGDKKFQHGIISLVVSNPSTVPVYCEQIKIILPKGGEPWHLTETPDTISAYVHTNDAEKVWEVSDITDGVITAKPKDEVSGFGEISSSDSVVLYFYYIQVNKKTGIFEINIEERTYKNNEDCTPKGYTQSFSKFPHGFFLKDFAAYKEVKEGDKELIPITEVDNSGAGEMVTLAWKGASTVRYSIFFRDPEDPSKDIVNAIGEGHCTWTSTSYIRDTTTFRLEATAGEGQATVRGFVSVTVGVRMPDMTVKTLKVGGKERDGVFWAPILWGFLKAEEVFGAVSAPEGFKFLLGENGGADLCKDMWFTGADGRDKQRLLSDEMISQIELWIADGYDEVVWKKKRIGTSGRGIFHLMGIHGLKLSLLGVVLIIRFVCLCAFDILMFFR